MILHTYEMTLDNNREVNCNMDLEAITSTKMTRRFIDKKCQIIAGISMV